MKQYYVIETHNGVKICGYGQKFVTNDADLYINFDWAFTIDNSNDKLLSSQKTTPTKVFINYMDLLWPTSDMTEQFVKDMKQKFKI